MRQKTYHAIALFLIIWGCLTIGLNSWNAEAFGLQNATVAALVQNKTFALVDQVIPGFNLVEGTETFRFRKNVYPMKQPGQTVFGAIIYYPLTKIGITFTNHFHYASHLITMFSAGVLAAGAAVLMFLLTNNWWLSTIMIFGTMVGPYAGVSHHDVMGMFFVTLSLYYYLKEKYFWAGVWATCTFFFTMLPLTWPVALLVMTVIKRRSSLMQIASGMLLGILPTFIFNQAVFGSPWLVANLAGKVSDTIPLLSLSNLGQKLWFYFGASSTAVWAFFPVTIWGIIGIWKEKRLLIPLCLHILHISSMATFGGFQYGPRYLMPMIPILFLGINAWIEQSHGKFLKILFFMSIVYSISVGLIGILQTVMYPVPGPFAPKLLLGNIFENKLPEFRMIIPGLVLFGGGILAKLRLGKVER